MHYFIRYSDANQLSWGLPFHCTCMSSSVADNHTSTPELHKVWFFEDNLSGFNLLNQNVGMVANVASGEIPECESK